MRITWTSILCYPGACLELCHYIANEIFKSARRGKTKEKKGVEGGCSTVRCVTYLHRPGAYLRSRNLASGSVICEDV